MPTAPAAPVLFTTPTGFFSTFSISAATGRAVRSATPPGGNGATTVIGRLGNVSCAPAWLTAKPIAQILRTEINIRFIGDPPFPTPNLDSGRRPDANLHLLRRTV